MSATVGEANALCCLLGQLTGERDLDPGQLFTCVALLTKAAHKTLGAGYRPDQAGEIAEALAALITRDRVATAAAEQTQALAVEVCEALARHEAHGGSIPWPSIRNPYEAWKAAVLGGGT